MYKSIERVEKKDFLHIIHKYLSGEATEEERRLVETYYDYLELQEGASEEELTEKLGQDILENVWDNRPSEGGSNALRNVRFIYLRRIAAAIIVLVALGVVWFNLTREDTATDSRGTEALAVDSVMIQPASKKAILTLANGRKVTLGQGQNKILNRSIEQHSDQLVYRKYKEAQEKEQYNKLETPNGGEFKIVLSDGTKVWLNAGSTLRYPVSFSGDDRVVKLTGEAYFEVTSQKDHPFKVEVADSRIQVLGTHFNIRSYPGERLKATLVQGAVRVTKNRDSKLLKPGQQAVLGKEIVVRAANLDKVLAWKKDLFYFDDTNIENIMNELSRWYNIKVVYDTNDLKKLNFSGVMSRYSDIDDVLKRLSLTGTVHFRIAGRRVKVLP